DGPVVLSPDASVPDGFRVVEGVERDAVLETERGQRLAEIEARFRADNLAHAARRRELGLPPRPPLDPGAVPEVQEAYDAWVAAGRPMTATDEQLREIWLRS